MGVDVWEWDYSFRSAAIELLASFPGCFGREKRPGNFRQFKLFTDITSRQLHTSFNQWSPRDTSDIFTGWERSFPARGYAGSATEGKQKMNEQKSSCRAPTLARSIDQLLWWMGVTAMVQCMTQFGLLLSCDSELKSDWDFQLSGSGSNSLNWRKLPGRFSLPKRPGNEAIELHVLLPCGSSQSCNRSI